jgi:hypothetical protein
MLLYGLQASLCSFRGSLCPLGRGILEKLLNIYSEPPAFSVVTVLCTQHSYNTLATDACSGDGELDHGELDRSPTPDLS